jgi:hypothetical protein
MRFPESEARQDAWGRFLELKSNRARLITRVRLEKGDRMSVSFELPGEPIEDLFTEVSESTRDEDGYYVCLILFPKDDDRVRLGRVLQKILTRQPS